MKVMRDGIAAAKAIVPAADLAEEAPGFKGFPFYAAVLMLAAGGKSPGVFFVPALSFLRPPIFVNLLMEYFC